MAEEQLQFLARRALESATAFSLGCQKPDRHWVAEVSSDATFTSEYIMFKYAMGLDLSADGHALRRWLLQDQKSDGSWGLAPDLPGNVSTTTEAYLALKILGVSPDHPAMLRSQSFMIRSGGVAKVRFFTRFFLATFGLFPWTAIPQLPAELILMPPSSPLNIYTLSSWARSTLVPILLVDHHQPVYALPNGLSPDNDFLDELWVSPNGKNVPYAPPLSSLFWRREYLQFGFTAIDKVIASLGNGLRNFTPLRAVSRKKCVEWLLEHQEEAGDWAGFFPPMHGSIWALILEGFPLDCKSVSLGLAAMERLAIEDSKGKRIAATVSPVWDTALMTSSLCDAGLAKDARIQEAADWIRARQLNHPTKGDWRIFSPNTQAGGWSFEYENTWYPDVDDTAVVVMALVKQDAEGMIGSKSIADAVQWILGMQNRDGGWGAFDYDNNKLWLHKIPFSDMDSLCDPSSSDITGRILECFGFLLSHCKRDRVDIALREKMSHASRRAVSYLMKEQEAPTSAWWGRWGNNYIYGSSNVLRGLVYFATTSSQVQQSVRRAINWFESIQNKDGGWGETLESYTNPKLIGRGVSTAGQTAWAIQALLPYRSASSSSIQRGIRWLIDHQSVKSENGTSWPADIYIGTGFPKVLYLGYPYYHHAFPIMALSQYIEAVDIKAESTFRPVELPLGAVEIMGKPNVLFMVVGSHGDIQPFLRIASLLCSNHGCHARIATHGSHRELIEHHGLEFYSVGGSPELFAKVFREKPNVAASFFKGEYMALRHVLHDMMEKFWRAGTDSPVAYLFEDKVMAEKISSRPFLADIIASNPPTGSHIHAAEALGIPLVLVSLQPELPTRAFPHSLTMTQPKIQPGHWWNLMSYHCIHLVNSLAFATFLNRLRVKVYGMRRRPWVRTLFSTQSMNMPYACLWSPHVVPRSPEWSEAVQIAGYTSPLEGNSYMPPKALARFLETDRPVLAIGFGSMDIPHPGDTARIICEAVERIGAKAVICGTWPQDVADMTSVSDDVYFIPDIPHNWLLRRVQGFVHHGGAGHTAAGMKAGIPMLVLPFFLDQNFWAAKVHHLGLGPAPISFRDMTSENLVASLRELLLLDTYTAKCRKMSTQLSSERDGGEVVADMLAFELKKCQRPFCSLIPALQAPWKHASSGLTLSGVAAASLASQGVLNWSDLDLHSRLGPAGDSPTTTELRFASMMWLLTSLYGVLLQFLLAVLGQVEDHQSRLRNPVFQARLRQSNFDLAWVEQQEFGRGIREQIRRNWQFLATARFQGKFDNDT